MFNKGLSEIYRDYNRTKIHGGIPIRSKCEFDWSNGTLCLHQVAELAFSELTIDELIKRDFKK